MGPKEPISCSVKKAKGDGACCLSSIFYLLTDQKSGQYAESEHKLNQVCQNYYFIIFLVSWLLNDTEERLGHGASHCATKIIRNFEKKER